MAKTKEVMKMAVTSEQLISKKTAEIAKRAGFNVPIQSYYMIDKTTKVTKSVGTKKKVAGEITRPIFVANPSKNADWNKDLDKMSAPTLSLVQRWLIDNFDLHPIATLNTDELYDDDDEVVMYCSDIFWREQKDSDRLGQLGQYWDTHTEAMEEAVQAGLRVIAARKKARKL